MDNKWVRITPGNMNWFNESMNNYKWIDSSVGKSLFLPSQGGGKYISLLTKEPNEDMTIHFGFRVTRRVSRYVIPLFFGGFNYASRSDAQLRLRQSEYNAMAMTFWGVGDRLTWGMGLYIGLNTNYEFDIVCEKEAMNIYCNGVLRASISNFGRQRITYIRIGRNNYPGYDFDSDYEFYDIFCIKKALKPDPNKPIGAVFHPEYCYHHMYDDFGIKIK